MSKKIHNFNYIVNDNTIIIFSEKIRRKDLEVARALEEKHRLVAEYYQIPVDLSEVADVTSSSTLTSRERDAREVLLAALVQGMQFFSLFGQESEIFFRQRCSNFFSFHFSVKSLSDLVNESLSLSEMDAVAASSRLSSASAIAAATTNAGGAPSTTTPGGKSIDDTATENSSVATEDAADEEVIPTLSSLASEAIGNDELPPAARVLQRLQPPTGKLIAITKNMNHHLTSLLVRIHLQYNIIALQ